MRNPCLALVFLFLAGAAAPSLARGDEEENAKRLRSMPRDQRALLSEKLKQFATLAPAEQDAVRKLDQKLSSLPLADQVQFRAVLLRYHLWVQGLSEAQRAELNKTPPDQRMALVSRLRNQGSAAPEGRSVAEVLKIVDFGAPSLHEMAHFYKLWQRLTPAQRSELEKLAPGSDRQDRIHQLSQEHKIIPETRLTKQEVDALIARMEHQLDKKGWPLPPRLIPKKDIDKESRKQHASSLTKDNDLRRRAAENFYFVENPPKPVDSQHLSWFESTLPALLQPAFDYLPPEEARRRLTILYRLIFPHPAEMPAPKPVAAAKPTAPSRPKTVVPDPKTQASPF